MDELENVKSERIDGERGDEGRTNLPSGVPGVLEVSGRLLISDPSVWAVTTADVVRVGLQRTWLTVERLYEKIYS